MKKKKLLLSLLGVLLGIFSAGAATWEAPTLKFSNFAAGDTLYFYNVETSKFLSYQDSKILVGTEGIQIVPIHNSDNTYCLKCSVNGKDFTYMYISDTQTISINGDSASVHNKFTIDDNGDGSFKFRADKNDSEYGEAIYVDCFCGVSDFTAGSTVIPFATIDPSVSYAISWKVAKGADYRGYTAKNNLNLAMLTAQNDGIDITEALALYNNAASTNDQLIAATTKLKELIRAYDIAHATDDSPVDFTSQVASATCGSLTGWVMSPSDAFNNNNSKGYNWTGGVADGAIETWVSGPGILSDRSMLQKLTNLPNGKYIIGAFIIAAQQGNSPEVEDGQHGVSLYASASGLETYTMASTVGYSFKHYEAEAFVNDGTLTLGIVVKKTNCNWICLDNFSLKYCGTASVVSDLKARVKTALDSVSVAIATDGMNQTYMDDLQAKKTEAEALIANADATSQQVIDIYNALNKSLANAQANIAAYVALNEAFNNANDVLGNLTIETVQVSNLSDYLLDYDMAAIMQEKSLTTEQITDIITKLKALVTSATNSQLVPGSDVTYLVKDAGFDGDHSAWGTKLVDFEKSLAFKWCSGFDLNQTFNDVPCGTYKLQLQGFDRPVIWSAPAGYSDGKVYEYELWKQDPVARTAAEGTSMYMNSDSKKLMNYFGQGDAGMTVGWTTPDGWNAPAENPWGQGGTGTVRTFFDAGTFQNELTTVVTDGVLKIGIRSDFAAWTCFDNVRLTYVGTDRKDGIALLQNKLDAANKALESKMNGDLKKQLQILSDTSTVVLADENSQFNTMIILSNKLTKLMPKVNSSIGRYHTLAVVDTIVGNSVAKSEIVATEAGLKLKSLYDQTTGVYAMDYPTYVDADIDSLTALMGQEMLDAQAKAYITATGDVTAALLNPSFDFGNSFGWVNDSPTVTFKEAEVYNRTFNIFETLHGIPNGKYTIKAQAFFRPQSVSKAVNNYNGVDGATPDAIKSFLYANADSVPVKHIASEPSPTKLFENGDWQTDFGYVVGADSAYVPASMHGTSMYFALGKYDNEVSTVVTDNTLKIGIRMPDATGNSDYWTIFDNFRLYYVDATGVENALSTAKVVSTKIFDIGGMQRTKLTRGINIVKKEMSDGTFVTEKIVVR